MNPKPSLDHPHPIVVGVALGVATLTASGILFAVTGLFQSRGLPLQELAAAERACAEHVYVSEREACVREWIATANGGKVAHR